MTEHEFFVAGVLLDDGISDHERATQISDYFDARLSGAVRAGRSHAVAEICRYLKSRGNADIADKVWDAREELNLNDSH